MENDRPKWIAGLAATRRSAFGKIAGLLGASELSPETWDGLEELLIQADLGSQTSLEIVSTVKERARNEGIIHLEDLQSMLAAELRKRLIEPPSLNWPETPHVILITGVNGSGKTTSIAKLGQLFLSQGKRVLFIAADTFRAAAVEQLQIWGEKLQIPVVAGQQAGDPGAVVFDGIQSALARKSDLVLIDTAGRLHTRYNLMEELKKVHKVAGKALPGAPHSSWLVLDATTGQNALLQAEAFLAAIPLNGIVLAKLDSSARGGMVFAIQEKLGLPVIFAGLGETAQDLVPFNPDLFVAGILGRN